jgi:cytidine deaminase
MERLAQAAVRGVIEAAEAERLTRELGVDLPQLMTMLLPSAAALAKPPVSNFKVGVVCRGTTSGNLYFGTNLEFAGEALSFTVHAEQSSIANAWSHGEQGVDILATSAPPCGYCRQFLNELATAARLQIVTVAGTTPLSALLPESFGPRDLGVEAGLMAPQGRELTAEDDGELAWAALRAANRSWAPYSKAYAGVALRTADGFIASGAYAENAAFNPSLSPLQAALSNLNLAGHAFDSITEAVLVQTSRMHSSATETVLAAVAPGASLRVLIARNSHPEPSR